MTKTNNYSYMLAALTALVALVAPVGAHHQADAASSTDKIVFVSNLTTGEGVNNPTGDDEIFRINPDGTGLRQLTFNTRNDGVPALSPDGQKVAYKSYGNRNSNPEGDAEIYIMNTRDGSGKKNLSSNGPEINENDPGFSPGGKKIAYESYGKQASNPEGDDEVYVMNALDGSGKKNLSNNGEVGDYTPAFSPDGQKIAYASRGKQTSNPEGDSEVFIMNVLDGKGKKNLSNNGDGVTDDLPTFSPGGEKIAYVSYGTQISNPEGDYEVYAMSSSDGRGKSNLTNNDVTDYDPVFSASGTRVAYDSFGIQTSNLEGDSEVFTMSATDGASKKNLTNNGTDVNDYYPLYSPDGTKIAYLSDGEQTSNPEGDREIYGMNAPDGTGQQNLSNNGTGFDEDYPDWEG